MSSRSASSLNSTAYRIFTLLTGLMVRPHSVDELNQRLQADPLIGKTVSQDSIWLYLNTLRLLGCEISRPMPANAFRHCLLSHPFGFALNAEDLNTLAALKLQADDHLPSEALKPLEQAFLALIQQAMLPEQDPALEAFLQTTGLTLNQQHQPDEALLNLLREAAETKQLLRVSYHSPVHGPEQLTLLAQSVSYRRGLYYLRGLRSDRFEQLTHLRLDRLIEVKVLENKALRQVLLETLEQDDGGVELYLEPGVAAQWQSPGFPTQYFWDEQQGLRIQILTQNWFELIQHLLVSGLPVQVLRPQRFQALYQQTLEAMIKTYETESTLIY